MLRLQSVAKIADDILRPVCKHCGAQAWLTRIEHISDRERDALTFECPVCEVAQTRIVRHHNKI
jgi:hypothetical protein